ncbi:class I SAM-dependent methyltransferase [Shewanella sp. 10N.286.52.B9]|uniref:class I SAM-dependent methyltransferase n=1 Tax=Shewanella sp. 10N.286.52.B9 TaxID=1880837 RepID=UPI000C81EA58|nr:class I SAM-dependent methyltransferase [Shewanella sp. 10N.286.52.B9]PMG47133.1 SAM-dependent methyltransferase [Shewanella sp. 10N.286.52.B9]
MKSTSLFYSQNAIELAEQYNSLDFKSVHHSWKLYWPESGSNVLDIGAGSGRDAKWMNDQGCEVIAVEPNDALRQIGRQSIGPEVTWLNDSLPVLKNVQSLGMRFDLILVSAVWMHLAPSLRERAFRKLSNLLSPNGKLVISLRHGEFTDGRQGFSVSVEELEKLSKDHGLQLQLVSGSEDNLQRADVSWQTVVLNLPDDGSGNLNTVRRIIVNDSKSATYKLALLRTLLRIADAHSGAVLDRSDGKIALSAGLVALYWVRQFKRLIDVDIEGHGIQQNSNATKGLGFVKDDGWNKLKHLSADDFSIGALYVGEEAKAIQKLFTHTISTIKAGPVTFIYQGDKQNKLFEIQAAEKRRKYSDTIILDSEFFTGFGQFILDEKLWGCFRLYHSWIEPLVVNQWVKEMQRFKLNQDRNISLQSYHDSLVWIDSSRDTRYVRKRVDELQAEGTVIHSAWSNTVLKSQYDVDHCLPFAYWPNNDKWNLLPATSNENRSKSDRVPKARRLFDSKERILEWWQIAWGSDPLHQQRFFTEATFSLPNVPAQCNDFEEVFEAMGLQIRGVRSRLLVSEW